jgi:hypothetical protein
MAGISGQDHPDIADGPKSEMSERSKVIISAIIPLLVAIIGGAVAIYTGHLHFRTDGRDDSAATITSFEDQVRHLQDELERQADSGTPRSTTTTNGRSSSTEHDGDAGVAAERTAVYEGVGMQLPCDNTVYIDLDAPTVDPPDGGMEFVYDCPEEDINSQGSTSFSHTTGLDTPGPDECIRRIDLEPDLDSQPVRPGETYTICALTDSDYVVQLEFVAVSDSGVADATATAWAPSD